MAIGTKPFAASPKTTQLPNDQSATLPTFIDAVEELVRLALRKSLLMKEDGKKLRQPEYWDTLMFPNSMHGEPVSDIKQVE